MNTNYYKVLEEAVKEGVDWGFVRVYRYKDSPTEDEVKEAVKTAVMASIVLALCEEGKGGQKV
jgi:hypothetical protein